MKFSLKNIPEQRRLLLLSFVVGIGAGLAAVLLTSLIGVIKHHLDAAFTGNNGYAWQNLVLPGAGMLITALLLRFLVKDNIGHGVTKVLLAVSRNESRIKPHNMWSSMLTSAFTIGFGGSVGAEAPIVYTGAAIGSNIGRWCGLSYRNVTTLLGCGAAAAVAGIFKAPLAGVLFTMEILLFNISMSSMLPLLVSTVSATVVSCIFLGQTPMFACTLTAFSMGNIPYYIIMGAILGFCSLYFTNVTLKLEDWISNRGSKVVKWVLCSLALGVCIFLFPPLYGEGYGALSQLLTGDTGIGGASPLAGMLQSKWGVPLFFLMVFLLKVVSMTLTNAGGGNGGTFGPTLFAGAVMGFAVARTMNLLGASVPEQNFVLVGMAALMAGVMQAPMTAIFLIAEISGGYALLLPLILTSAVSYGTVRIFDRYSIYTKRIAQSGDLLTHNNDKSVLTLLRSADLVRDKYPRLHIDDTLRSMVDVVCNSTAAIFPVLDNEERFQGQISMDTFRKYLTRDDLFDKICAHNLMEQPPAYVTDGEKMESVMDKFDRTDAWRLPVTDANGRYLGFISKSRILMAYREEVKEISQD